MILTRRVAVVTQETQVRDVVTHLGEDEQLLRRRIAAAAPVGDVIRRMLDALDELQRRVGRGWAETQLLPIRRSLEAIARSVERDDVKRSALEVRAVMRLLVENREERRDEADPDELAAIEEQDDALFAQLESAISRLAQVCG